MKLPLYFQRRFIHFKNILRILNENFPYLYIDNYCEKHICTKKKVNIPLINSTSFLVIYLDRIKIVSRCVAFNYCLLKLKWKGDFDVKNVYI